MNDSLYNKLLYIFLIVNILFISIAYGQKEVADSSDLYFSYEVVLLIDDTVFLKTDMDIQSYFNQLNLERGSVKLYFLPDEIDSLKQRYYLHRISSNSLLDEKKILKDFSNYNFRINTPLLNEESLGNIVKIIVVFGGGSAPE